MAYSSTISTSSTHSEVYNDSNCCSSCLECVKDLKEQNEQLVKDLRTARISDISYKTGLESIEARLLLKATVETNEPKTARKENGAPIIEDWVSESEEQDEPKFQIVKPNFTKIEFVKPKTDRKPVEQIRQATYSPSFSPSRSPRGNKRNRNQQMSQKLGSDFEIFNKACHVCGNFDHLKKDCNNWYNNRRFAKPVWTNVQRVNKHNFSKLTHPSPKRNMVPRTVLSRPFNNITESNNSNFTKKVNTVKGTRVNTAKPKAVLKLLRKWTNWLFDIDALTRSMNYKPVVGNQSNGNAGTKACDDVDNEKIVTKEPVKEGGDSSNDQEKDDNINSTDNINTATDGNNTNNVNVVSSTVDTASIKVNDVDPKSSIKLPDDPNMPELENIVYSDDDEDVGCNTPKIVSQWKCVRGRYFIIHSARYKRTTSKCVI
ncbi:hypothetical protein Tco_1276425 [Tanacetum coccineum]